MAYRDWLTVSLEYELERLQSELSRAERRLSTLLDEYNRKFARIRYVNRQITRIEERIVEAEREVRRARKISKRRFREAQEALADVRAEITPFLARREEVVADAKYERDVLLRPLEARIKTLRANIKAIEDELEARKCTVTVRSTPINVAFTYDGVQEVTPVSFIVYRGDVVTVYMPDRAYEGEEEYEFKSWENGSTDPTRRIRVVEDVTVTATYEVPPLKYVQREYTTYIEYSELKATPHSPAVKFEARGVFTIPSDLDPEDEHVRAVIEAKLLNAIVEIGKERTRIDPLTREVITETFEPSVIDPYNFEDPVTGVEDTGEPDVAEFKEVVLVTVTKYLKGKEVRHWDNRPVSITESELRK